MTKWEYQFLTAARAWWGGTWKVRWINGDELPRWQKGPSLYEYCNRMGEQGWEVIGLSEAPVRRENFRVVLKRPKS